MREIPLRKTEAARVLSYVLASLLMGCISPALAAAEQTKPLFPVGLRQIEFADGSRPLALAMFYPAEIGGSSPAPFKMPFFTKLHLYQDAQPAAGPFPLVMLSHGRGSNPLLYAWFAETRASHGYIVAGLYHYRANTYDQTIAYLANKLWQRPHDVSLALSFLLNDPFWGKQIDAGRIGVAGHS
jgi:predicted dienelactone hydrolase